MISLSYLYRYKGEIQCSGVHWFAWFLDWFVLQLCLLMGNLVHDRDLVVAILSIIYFQVHVCSFILSRKCHYFAINQTFIFHMKFLVPDVWYTVWIIYCLLWIIDLMLPYPLSWEIAYFGVCISAIRLLISYVCPLNDSIFNGSVLLLSDQLLIGIHWYLMFRTFHYSPLLFLGFRGNVWGFIVDFLHGCNLCFLLLHSLAMEKGE